MKASRELVGADWINSRQKRAMDLAYATATAPFLIPIGATVMALSRIVDGRGAIFSHQRLGREAKSIKIRKIRTLENSGPYEPGLGTYNRHATTLGKLLRPLAIDEIPQLVNVFRGELSVVGPRILYPSGFDAMEDILPRNLYDEWEESYFMSKPGGVSSVTSARRISPLGFEESVLRKAQLDIADFKNTSFRYDNLLLARAGKAIVGLGINGSQEHWQASLSDSHIEP